jgi:hypothetical protein
LAALQFASQSRYDSTILKYVRSLTSRAFTAAEWDGAGTVFHVDGDDGDDGDGDGDEASPPPPAMPPDSDSPANTPAAVSE